MKKIIFCSIICLLVCACKPTKAPEPETSIADTLDIEEPLVSDSTLYGTCGDGTMMNTLQLITDAGDTLTFGIDPDQEIVKGGMLTGDRIAVVGAKNDADAENENVAQRIINITTLLGKWTNVAKNFEIQEGGTVQSDVAAESHPWLSWRILNGQLLLNRDTFDILMLGPDSLYLENKEGVFAFKRQQ